MFGGMRGAARGGGIIMEVDYITQPDLQLGKILESLLQSEPAPSRVVFVSAFVSVQTLMRMKNQILAIKKAGTDVRFVLGIDLGGTSREALSEVLTWDIDCRIIKNNAPRHTFHPKLYLFEWDEEAAIIIGSNNITEGGFFGNYEAAAHITYDLQKDARGFARARDELARFLAPDSPVAKSLTEGLLQELVSRGDVPTEEELRKRRSASLKTKPTGERKGEPIFGIEDFDPPPPLPADLLERLIKDVRKRRSVAEKSDANKKMPAKPIDDAVGDTVRPAAFYMTLPKMQGDNIPGEARVPLEAIELAKEFWGWPDEYSKEESPRAGKNRVYWNWRPKWRIWAVEEPPLITAKEVIVTEQEVRMYMYENSSDFRFFARPLVNAGADVGDIVRIRRIAEPDVEFECVLAHQGSPTHKDWIKSCTQPVRNSSRRFGYA
jgi:HKD family nuclease